MDCLHSLNSHCTVHGLLASSTLPKFVVRAIKSRNTFSSVHSPHLGSSADESQNLRHQTAAGHRQSLFNHIASNYDHLNDLLSLGQHRVWKRMAVSWSGAKAGDIVLDICCGSGDMTFLLAEKVGVNGKVTGLDFANEQLTIASERQAGSSNACYRNIDRWVQGDALNLPFADFSFNAVTVGYGLRNVVDITQALREIYRLLRRGSTVSILDFNRSSNSTTTFIQDWVLDNVVVPVANGYGLGDDYAYLKTSIAKFPTVNENCDDKSIGSLQISAKHRTWEQKANGVFVIDCS